MKSNNFLYHNFDMHSNNLDKLPFYDFRGFIHCSTQDSKTRLEIVGIDMPSNNKNLFFILHYVPAVTPILQ